MTNHTMQNLLIFFRYLFNCGEDVTRYFLAKQSALVFNTYALFITSKCLKNISGLPSVLLMKAEISRKKYPYYIYGPKGLVS